MALCVVIPKHITVIEIGLITAAYFWPYLVAWKQFVGSRNVELTKETT